MTGDHAPPAVAPTPEQRAVIEHPLEPLRVTAGAGTGKTMTMAMRLAHVVRELGIAPEEALGITFTNKAVEELASRIRHFLPEHTAEGREVQVLTYHGFAYGLLREFGPLVGLPRDVRTVPAGYVRQLLRDSLGAAPRLHLDLTQPGRRVDELNRLASELGDHLLDPAALTGGGDEAAAAREEMAEVLAEFQRRKAAAGIVDYADMVATAHRLVSDAALAERIRDRYRIVLLDEYQDTNPAQRELLRAIFGDGFPVTAVGDSDQTIYEWRGASPANFADFGSHFPLASGDPAPSLDLSINWRSAASIVAAANAVRGFISEPSSLEALVPRPDAPPGVVRARWLRTAMDEAEWIADELARIHDEEGRRWRDMAVLFRKHRQMGLVRDAMAKRGIPMEVASLGGLLEVPEVVDLHAWLRILGRPDDDVALARVLLGAGFRLGLGDLAPLARWSRRKQRGDQEDLLGWALLESFDHPESLDGVGDEARRRLERFIERYRSLLEAAQTSNLVDLCRLVLDRTGAWLELEALDDAARLSARLNLYRFLDLAEDWSPLDGSPSLEAFLDYLELLAEDGADDALDAANVSGEDAVPLLTVHRAKGLEWPVVFLPALCDGTFPSGVQTYEDPSARAEVLPHHLRLDSSYLPDLGSEPEARKEVLRRRHDDQEWRAAYVAVTRARDELVASGAFWYTKGKHRRPSDLFEAVAGSATVPVPRSGDPGDPPESLAFDREWADAPDPLFADGWQAAMADAIGDPRTVRGLAEATGLAEAFDAATGRLRLALEGLPRPLEAPDEPPFRTSVTGLVTYASCPRRFHWGHVDRLPRRPSPAARRGTALHRRIEQHLTGTMSFADLERPDPDSSVVEGPVETAFDRFLGSRFAGAPTIAVEAPFSLSIAGARVDGRVDAIIEPEEGVWEVVDFKSGRAGDDPTRRIQLEAYAVALDEAGLVARREADGLRVTFAFFGGDQVVEETEDVDAEWLASARDRLAALVTAAASGDSRPVPSDACRWCDFSRFCDEGSAWLEANR